MASISDFIGCPVSEEPDLRSTSYDGIVLVHWPGVRVPEALRQPLQDALQLDQALETEAAVVAAPLPAGRLVLSPTGPIDADYHDVRVFKNAAKKGVQRAVKAGVKRPLLVLGRHADYGNVPLSILLGALDVLYVPLQVRETKASCQTKVEYMGVWSESLEDAKKTVQLAKVLESGLFVARDIGGSDPERMAPPRVLEYVQHVFADSCIRVSVVEDVQEIAASYPLFEAVNRAASVVDRHRGCIIYLEYTPADAAKLTDTVFLVGKGVTYDTGGADIKAGGVMAGMSRDKCGAAAVAGFMQLVKELRPSGVRVVAGMSMVRNSVGSNCYVADEVIVSRAGAAVRVGNTDAEGRMVMADVLCKMKEMAVDAVNPHLYTIATLTGHACLAVGDYSIVLDNGPARKQQHALNLQRSGEEIGDPFEVSTLRMDDIEFHRGKCQGDDIMQCNNAPSSRTPRGHQGPAGFLLLASGLDAFGSGSQCPLKYSHLDVAGSAGSLPDDPTGAPILALANTYLLRKM